MRTAACTARFGDFVYLNPVRLPLIGDKHDIVMRRSSENLVDKVIFNQGCRIGALAAAVLPLVGGNRHPLDVAEVGNQHYHLLFFDEVFNVDFFHLIADNIGTAVVAEFLCKLIGFLLNKRKNFFRMRQEVFQMFNQQFKLLQFLAEVFNFEAGEALELHINDCLRLYVIKREPLHQRVLGACRIAGAADNLNYLIDVVDGDDKSA